MSLESDNRTGYPWGRAGHRSRLSDHVQRHSEKLRGKWRKNNWFRYHPVSDGLRHPAATPGRRQLLVEPPSPHAKEQLRREGATCSEQGPAGTCSSPVPRCCWAADLATLGEENTLPAFSLSSVAGMKAKPPPTNSVHSSGDSPNVFGCRLPGACDTDPAVWLLKDIYLS